MSLLDGANNYVLDYYLRSKGANCCAGLRWKSLRNGSL